MKGGRRAVWTPWPLWPFHAVVAMKKCNEVSCLLASYLKKLESWTNSGPLSEQTEVTRSYLSKGPQRGCNMDRLGRRRRKSR
ncbi:hypothetical protein B0H66DRAFT_50629 [Apodospora peruviana]|uniref:Secreted protein n=1 Tax=Apodospora peruviana TaxID=516989 RepID=A0AAE0MF59_9PEZI|nr:hypothetical protein B0H66DRAFT_50629 [Apodospora peruviana]